MSRNASPSERTLRAADRLHSAAIRVLRRVRSVDEESGLSAARLSALSVVVFGGPLTLGRLAELEQVRPPTVTALVRGLEADGLVRRVPDERDRRVTQVEATARGRRLLKRAQARRLEVLADLLGSLSEKEQQRVTAAAETVLGALSSPRAADEG